MSNRIDVYLVCNAKYHDTNFARLELLKLFAEHEDVWARVADSYVDLAAITASRFLVTYTCDLCPTLEQQAALRQFLEKGGRWQNQSRSSPGSDKPGRFARAAPCGSVLGASTFVIDF